VGPVQKPGCFALLRVENTPAENVEILQLLNSQYITSTPADHSSLARVLGTGSREVNMDALRIARESTNYRGQGHCAEFLQQADTGGPARSNRRPRPAGRPCVMLGEFEREDRDASFPPPLGHAGAPGRPRDPGIWRTIAAMAALRTHRPGDATGDSVASSRGAVFPAPVPRCCLPSASDARRGQRAPASPFSLKHRFSCVKRVSHD
jgi:hypothetical protein